MREIVRYILDNELKEYKTDCPPDIIDLVFCIIEEDYIWNYNRAVERTNAGVVNRDIGKTIREYWHLKNGEVEIKPSSSLIARYTKQYNK